MNGIDLIPPAYRFRRRLRREALVAGLALITGLAAVGGLRLFVDHSNQGVTAELESRRAATVLNERQRQELRTLATKAEALDRRLAEVDNLARPRALAPLFEGVETTLVEDVWFKRMEYAADQSSGEAGALSIQGLALTHGALATFVDRLAGQSLTTEVTLSRAELRPYTRGEVVEFELRADIAGEERDGQAD